MVAYEVALVVSEDGDTANTGTSDTETEPETFEAETSETKISETETAVATGQCAGRGGTLSMENKEK